MNVTDDTHFRQPIEDHRSSHNESAIQPNTTFWRPSSRQSQEQDVKFTIPLGHRTTSASLFAFPQIQTMIGKYPENIFLHIESQRTVECGIGRMPSLFHSLNSIDHQRETTEPLVRQFFANIHPHLPVLDHDNFLQTYNSFVQDGAHEDSDTALCLMVLSLGRLSLNIHHTGEPTSGTEVGDSGLFQTAYQLTFSQWSMTITPNPSLLMSLIYGALHLCYLFQPLQAWKLTHMASTSLQTLVLG